MKKYIVILAMLSLSMCGFGISANASDIVWQDIGRGNLNLNAVIVNPDNPRIIYIGSSNGVFKTEDGGKTWRNVLSVKGKNRVVNFLLFDPHDKNSLFAATGNGLFYSSNQGKTWEKIFKGKSYLESECTSIAILPYSIYLGTKSGCFVSIDKGRSWHKETGKLGNSRILAIASDLKEPDYVYVACVEGVYKTQNKGRSWEEIFAVSPTENNNNHDDEDEPEDQEEASKVSNIRYITLDHHNLDYLYLATSKGVYKSQDRGQSWELFSSYGLLNREVRFLLVSPKSCLYAVTKSGIFEYKNDMWVC